MRLWEQASPEQTFPSCAPQVFCYTLTASRCAASVQHDSMSRAGHLLRLKDSQGRHLTKARLMAEFAIFFIAGSETTGHTVAWTL